MSATIIHRRVVVVVRRVHVGASSVILRLTRQMSRAHASKVVRPPNLSGDTAAGSHRDKPQAAAGARPAAPAAAAVTARPGECLHPANYALADAGVCTLAVVGLEQLAGVRHEAGGGVGSIDSNAERNATYRQGGCSNRRA